MNEQKDISLVYVYPKRYYFVRKDIEGLAERHTIFEHEFIHGSSSMLLINLIRQFAFLLRSRIRGVRHVIAHFAGYHTVLPVLFGFKTYIIVAGSDACSFPGINYGSFRKYWMGGAMAFSLRNAEIILPVHPSLEYFENSYSDLGPRQQGYGQFVSNLKTSSLSISYGFDPQQWRSENVTRAPKTAICVAFGARAGDPVHLRKGLDLILKAATELKDHHFTLVGLAELAEYSEVPKNVTCLGTVSPSELKELYAAHSMVLQPSVMEGFPNALCEAMLCGCIPIASNVTSMPSIVGGTGVIIGQRNSGELVRAIRSITELSPEKQDQRRKLARERILLFSMERRIAQLNNLLQ